jgi:hypothetical protein
MEEAGIADLEERSGESEMTGVALPQCLWSLFSFSFFFLVHWLSGRVTFFFELEFFQPHPFGQRSAGVEVRAPAGRPAPTRERQPTAIAYNTPRWANSWDKQGVSGKMQCVPLGPRNQDRASIYQKSKDLYVNTLCDFRIAG